MVLFRLKRRRGFVVFYSNLDFYLCLLVPFSAVNYLKLWNPPFSCRFSLGQMKGWGVTFLNQLFNSFYNFLFVAIPKRHFPQFCFLTIHIYSTKFVPFNIPLVSTNTLPPRDEDVYTSRARCVGVDSNGPTAAVLYPFLNDRPCARICSNACKYGAPVIHPPPILGP